MNPHRNLLVMATNRLLELGHISLNAEENYDVKRMDKGHDRERGHVFTNLAGKNSVLLWSDVGFQEFRISAWWDYNHANHPQADLTGNSKEQFHISQPLAKRQKYKDFVGVTCSAWFERKEGKYLQGKGKDKIFDIYTKNSLRSQLIALPIIKPFGFKAEGRFHM